MSLSGDLRTVPGQNYVLLSVVGPDCPQKTEKYGLKISGCFPTQEDAEKHAKKLQSDDGTFDIFVASMYNWLLIPPDRDQITPHYADEKLEEIMTKYRENQIQAAKMFEDRKKDMMARPTDGAKFLGRSSVKQALTCQLSAGSFIKPGDENSKFYNKPDEAPISHPAEVVERLRAERPGATQEELMIEAEAIVAGEVRQRQKQRLIDAAKATKTQAALPPVPLISNVSDVLERLKKEKPDAAIEDLIDEADAIVEAEIKERQRLRLAQTPVSQSTGTDEEYNKLVQKALADKTGDGGDIAGAGEDDDGLAEFPEQ